LLPTKEIQQNIYIKHPVSIEQYMMEGSYNKVPFCTNCLPTLSDKTIPLLFYDNFFLQIWTTFNDYLYIFYVYIVSG